MAVIFVLVTIACMLVLGLLADAGWVAVQRTRLDHAADAAAHAAAKACHGDGECAAQTAYRYLRANLPGAHLEQVAYTSQGKVAVRASLIVPLAFSALWKQGPLTLQTTGIGAG